MASFKKHNTGWEYRLKYKDPFTQKFKENSKRGFATKAEAKIAADDFLRSIREGYEQSDVRLVKYLENWLVLYKKGVVRKNTFKIYENSIKSHIAPYFKDLMLNDLKPDMYQKFLDQLTEKELSRRTIEIIHSTMLGAIDRAVIQGKLIKNPCIGAIIKLDKKEKSIKFIDSDQVQEFLAQASKYGYIYWIFFRTLIETGMRKGEAAALQWTDINFDKQTINIHKTLDFQSDSEDELFGRTKTQNSVREIKISNTLINDLKFHLKWQNQNKLQMTDVYRHDLNLVFCRNDGNIMPKSSLFNAFEKICKRSNLPKLSIHSLRHTCAVLMLEAELEMKYIQEYLGHGSVQITSDVYSHVSKKIEQRESEKYHDFMKDVLGTSGGILGAD